LKALIALRRSGEERRAGARRRCVDLGRSGEPAPGGAASIWGGAASRRCVDLGRSREPAPGGAVSIWGGATVARGTEWEVQRLGDGGMVVDEQVLN